MTESAVALHDAALHVQVPRHARAPAIRRWEMPATCHGCGQTAGLGTKLVECTCGATWHAHDCGARRRAAQFSTDELACREDSVLAQCLLCAKECLCNGGAYRCHAGVKRQRVALTQLPESEQALAHAQQAAAEAVAKAAAKADRAVAKAAAKAERAAAALLQKEVKWARSMTPFAKPIGHARCVKRKCLSRYAIVFTLSLTVRHS